MPEKPKSQDRPVVVMPDLEGGLQELQVLRRDEALYIAGIIGINYQSKSIIALQIAKRLLSRRNYNGSKMRRI